MNDFPSKNYRIDMYAITSVIFALMPLLLVAFLFPQLPGFSVGTDGVIASILALIAIIFGIFHFIQARRQGVLLNGSRLALVRIILEVLDLAVTVFYMLIDHGT